MSYSRSEQIRLELEKYNVQEIIRAIEELGERNTKGLLKPLSYNASKAYNNISVVSLPANPVANEHLAPLGRTAHIGFSAIENAWNEHIDMLAFVAGEMRNSKTNFTLVTNHSNVIDIALVLGAMRLAIDPWICGEDFSVSSGLVISRGIVSTQAVVENLSFSMPTVEVIQMFANVFF